MTQRLPKDRIPPHCFALDPGLASGIAELEYDHVHNRLTLTASYETTRDEVGWRLENFCTRYKPHEAMVVAEHFIITPKTATNSQAPWSLEINGMCKWIVHKMWGVDIERALHLQVKSHVDPLITNPVIRKLGLWHKGGAGHANVAIRHGVYRYAIMGVTAPFENTPT